MHLSRTRLLAALLAALFIIAAPASAHATPLHRWQTRLEVRSTLLQHARMRQHYWDHQHRVAVHRVRRMPATPRVALPDMGSAIADHRTEAMGRMWFARNMESSRRRAARHRRYQVAFARRVVSRHTPRRVRRSSSFSGPYALPYRIVMCESGGNPRAVNNTPAGQAAGRPAGLYQIVTGTWLGNGGGAFAPTADRATPREQGIIAARIWAGGRGAGQWECK